MLRIDYFKLFSFASVCMFLFSCVYIHLIILNNIHGYQARLMGTSSSSNITDFVKDSNDPINNNNNGVSPSGSSSRGIAVQIIDVLSYFSMSKLLLFILLNFCFNIFIWATWLVQITFLGQLKRQEFENAVDSIIYYLVFNTLFVLYVLEPTTLQERLIWTAWFSAVAFLKFFTIVTKERVGLVTNSIIVEKSIHTRLSILLALILLGDITLSLLAYIAFIEAGWKLLLLILYECVMVLSGSLKTTVKYAFYLAEFYSEKCESDSERLFYIDFWFDITRAFLTLLHYLHILSIHGLSISVTHAGLYILMRSIVGEIRTKISTFIKYRRLTKVINECFPDSTEEELRSYNGPCTICHNELKVGNSKKLPCSHAFHAGCIRKWMEYSAICPNCRAPLMPQTESDNADGNSNAHQGDRTGAAAANNILGAQNANNNNNNMQQRVQTRSLFNSRSSIFARWMPNFSVEVIRNTHQIHNNNNNDNMAHQHLHQRHNHSSHHDQQEALSPLPQQQQQQQQQHIDISATGNSPLFQSVYSAQIQQIQEMLPHISRATIAAELARSRGSVALALNNLLD